MKAISLSETHIATGGVHCVGLFDETKAVSIIEDIGRHNALDKAIGHALSENVNFGRTFVACTGRISSDMALEVLRGRYPHNRLAGRHDKSCHLYCREDGSMHHCFSAGKEAQRVHQQGEIQD